MVLAVSSPLSHRGPEDWAKTHVSLGLGAVNFHLTCEDDPGVVDAYVQEAERSGLVMAEVGIWRNTLAPDEDEQRAALKFAAGQLELADRIGARCCVNILGSRGKRWDGACRENYSRETWDMGVKMIRGIIDAVDPKNTWFTIESMPWMIPDGPDQYLELLEAVDRDRFAVHLDVFNWMTSPKRYFYNEEFVDECFEKLGKYTRSCHLKDVRLEEEYTLNFRETAPGTGGVNIAHLIRRAEECDPEMTFVIEHLDTDEEYIKSIAYVKNLMDQEKKPK